MTWSEEDSHHLTPEGRARRAEVISEHEQRERFLMLTSRRHRIWRRVEDLVRRVRSPIRNI